MEAALDTTIQGILDEGATPDVDRDAVALLETGRILITHGATTEGRRAALEAAKRLPDNAPTMNNVSLIHIEYYLKKGEPASAQTWLEFLEQTLPDQVPDEARERVELANLLETVSKIPSRLRKKR